MNFNPILTSKITPPPLQESLVERILLLKRLEEGKDKRLTIIAAPPGFGKTTLALLRARKAGYPTIWLTLDQGDNDSARFLSYVISALQTQFQSIGEVVESMIRSPQKLPMQSIVTALINELRESTKDFYLVLDDYHAIVDKEVHEILQMFIEHGPEQMRLVIVSRIDPPLPISRYRVRNQICELREQDMRLSKEETVIFFEKSLGLMLNDEQIDSLDKRAEGWVAGLLLAGIALKQRTDIDLFIEQFAGSNSYIVDYLTDEALSGQTKEIHDFLVKTSVFKRFSASCANYVLEIANSATLIEQLMKQQMFLLPTDGSNTWYRYHNLFADMLRFRLQVIGESEVTKLHYKAAEWFEENGMIEEAFRHLLEIGDFNKAANNLERLGRELLMKGEVATLHKLINSLPDEVNNVRPALLISKSWTELFTGKVSSAISTAKHAQKYMDENPNLYPGFVESELRGQIAVLSSFEFNPFFNPTEPDQEKQKAMLIRAKNQLRPDDVLVRSIVDFLLAHIYMYEGSSLDMALGLFKEVQKLGESIGNTIISTACRTHIARVSFIRGKLREAKQLVNETMQRFMGKDIRSMPSLAEIFFLKGELEFEELHYKEAMESFGKAIDLSKLTLDRRIEFYSTLFLALIAIDTNDLKQMRHYARDIEEMEIELRNIPHEAIYYFLSFSYYARNGKFDECDRIIATAEKGYLSTTIWGAFIYIIKGRLAYIRGDYEASLGLARLLWDDEFIHISFKELSRITIDALVLEAISLSKLKRSDEALNSMLKALELSHEEGFIRMFTWYGEEALDLLLKALPHANQKIRLYIITILGDQSRENSKSVQSSEEQLSERELEILRLIATGLSNKAIADKLFIAEGTIKKHSNTIYKKLGVETRIKAVEEAKIRGLI